MQTVYIVAGLVAALPPISLLFYFAVEHNRLLESVRSQINANRPVIVWYFSEKYKERLTYTLTASYLPEESTFDCDTGGKTVQCDVTTMFKYHKPAAGYLFYGSFLERLPLPRDPKTIWGLFHEETPNIVPAFWNDKVLNWFNFSCTFSRHSDVPMPLHFIRSLKDVTSVDKFVSTSAKNIFLTKIAPILYLQSDCDTSTERDAYVEKLMIYIRIDSYGKCVNNKLFSRRKSYLGFFSDYRNHIDSLEIYSFIAKYKFMIAIDNAVCNDYLTEKFWRAIYLGVVPIYFGDPLIRDWLPNNKSAILLEDYPTPELLSKHLYELLENDKKYEEYLEHKTKGHISNRKLIDEMKARPNQTSYLSNVQKLYCIMCERIHEFNTNSSRVNIVTKKHYDCPLPTSALGLSVNLKNPYIKKIDHRTNEIIYNSY